MYYVWENIERNLCPEILEYTDLPVEDMATKYYIEGGLPLTEALPLITFEVDDVNKLVGRDSLWAALPYLVFSSRLRAALKDVGVHSVQYFDALIREHKTGRTTSDYQIANIVGVVECMDSARSSYLPDPYLPGHVRRLDSLVLDESKIPAGLFLLRLAELPSVILCHEQVKDYLVRSGATGIEFLQPHRYSVGW